MKIKNKVVNLIFSIILVISIIIFTIVSGKPDNGLILVLMMFFLLPAIFFVYLLIIFIINKKWKWLIAMFILILIAFVGNYVYENNEDKIRKIRYEKHLENKKINNQNKLTEEEMEEYRKEKMYKNINLK